MRGGCVHKKKAADKEVERYARLIGLEQREQVIDKEFLSEVEAHQTILSWWKRHYGYSSNDERFLTATKQQVYRDRLEYVIDEYMREVGDNPQALRILKGRALDKDFDKKDSENFKKDMLRLMKEHEEKEKKETIKK